MMLQNRYYEVLDKEKHYPSTRKEATHDVVQNSTEEDDNDDDGGKGSSDGNGIC